ncbi:SpaA isopeptide-forming pilin-related protein [Gracilibacillus salitolerans]|uniref:SpaA isopeptide-forming pilin-related protein n=1 Tax=Gracilibacillus salitolerans TaxID=2663022 RepID=UPI001891AC28
MIYYEGLETVEYQFVEVKVPSGLNLLQEPISFTIEKSQNEVLSITVTNELLTGSVQLMNVDQDN